MTLCIDSSYLASFMQRIVEQPSPAGFCCGIYQVIAQEADTLGLELTRDIKGNGYVKIPGEDASRVKAVSAHVDTIGLMIQGIEPDGKIRVTRLGGVNFSSIEGETATVHARSGVSYSGMICCKSHSVHVFQDALTLQRVAENMFLLLDECVSSRADVESLGISSGDFVSLNPRFELTRSGFVKSRFIDNKGGVAVVFAALRSLLQSKARPRYDIAAIFTMYEEVGHGGAYVPQEVTEYLSVDVGLIGPELNGNEQSVSIIAKDEFGPYDTRLTDRLVNLARSNDIKHTIDVYGRYGTDGSMARIAGNNIITAAIGQGTYSTHGVERTHLHGLENTAKLVLAYLLDSENLT